MRHALTVFAFLSFLYLLTFGGHPYSPDEEVLFRTTESLATRASLDVEPLQGFATRTGTDGRDYAQYGVGQPIAAVPFYFLGRGLAHAVPADAWLRLRGSLRSEYPILGKDTPDEEVARAVACRLAVSSFNLLVTALSGAVLFLLTRRLCGADRPAWLAVLMWGAGSVAWAHSRTFFSEPLAGLCLLVAFERLARRFVARDGTESSPGDCGQGACASRFTKKETGATPVLLSGIAAAYGCLVRLDSAVFLPALAVLVVWGDFDVSTGWRQAARHALKRPTYLRLVAFAIPVVLAGGVVLGLNTFHFGSPLASAYSDQPEGISFSTPVLAGLYGFLLSVGKGMFFFSPPLVLGLWGFAPTIKRRPVFGLSILLAFASFLVFQSCWRNWAGGWCWGPRHIVQIHALLAIPIAFWLAAGWTRGRRFLAVWLLAVGAAVQLYGSSQSFIDFYRIYYMDPRPPDAQALYDPEQMRMLDSVYALFLLRDPVTAEVLPRPVQASPASLPAPINDSIYIVQNSQWVRYTEMGRDLRIHDLFWLHFMAARMSPKR